MSPRKSTKKPFAVTGFYTETQQLFCQHVKGGNFAEAIQETVRGAKREGADISDLRITSVLEGHVMDVSEFSQVLAAEDVPLGAWWLTWTEDGDNMPCPTCGEIGLKSQDGTTLCMECHWKAANPLLNQ